MSLGSEDGAGDPADPYIGAVLGDKYMVRGKLGTGGMGVVYEGENLAIGRRVAIKLMHPDCPPTSASLSRFRREARAAALLEHRNIIQIYDLGRTDEGLPFIIMEYLEGEDLLSRMSHESPLDPRFSTSVISQVLSAVGTAHSRGIVHRDLKAENIFLVEEDGRTDFVKVLDFGVAKLLGEAQQSPQRLTDTGHIVGTPAYMPPEQANASDLVDARSDLYSAGVLLYEMLAGRLPFIGDSFQILSALLSSREPPPLRSVAEWVPPDLEPIVMKAMAQRPADRFQTAAELMLALEPFRPSVLPMRLEIPPPPGPAQIERLSEPPQASPPSGSRLSGACTLVRARGSNARQRSRRSRSRNVTTPALFGRDGRARRAHWAVLLGAMALGAAGMVFGKSSDRLLPVAPGGSFSDAAVPPLVVLRVVSEPSGAEVLVDGQLLGTTPLSARLSHSTEPRFIELNAAGYRAASRQVSLDGPLEMYVELTALPESSAALDGGSSATVPRIEPSVGPRLVFENNVY